MSAAAGASSGGPAKRPREACSLSEVVVGFIEQYAGTKDDTLNAALYCLSLRSGDCELQMRFSRHVLRPRGHVSVQIHYKGAYGTADEELRRRKWWTAESRAEVAAVVQGRLLQCDDPFFLVLWRGDDFEPPSTLEIITHYVVERILKDFEEAFKETPVSVIKHIVTPSRPNFPAMQEDTPRVMQEWADRCAERIADEVYMFVGKKPRGSA